MNYSKKNHEDQNTNRHFVSKAIKNVISIVILVFTIGATAQQSINYKALIKDGGGNVVANDLIVVQFQILQGVGMTNVYQETHTPTTDANGFVILNIGEGSVNSGDYSTIDWGSDDHYLNVQIDIGTGLTDMGTTQFMAVPYALSSANAATKIDDLTDGKSDNDGTDDGNSIFLGVDAGANDDSSYNQNVGIGFNALQSNITGQENTANGYQALFSNTIGNYNNANGAHSLYSNETGRDNTATGFNTLRDNTTGEGNTATGSQALQSNVTGWSNTANGQGSLSHNTEGYYNTASGAAVLNSNTGSSNTAVGYRAGFSNITGYGNVFIGYQSGYNELGSQKLYIENSDADANNALIYGEFDTNMLRTNSQFQIGNPTGTGYAFPTTDGTTDQVLQTNGSGALSWINPSVASGLEALDESNGIGWRLIGRNPSEYGNIGQHAVDFSTSFIISDVNGATGTGSTAMGANTTASGDYSTAMGENTEASGIYSTAMGYSTTASGIYSTAMGLGTKANAYRSTAIGYYNIGGGNPSSPVSTDPLFEIGNGTFSVPANALTVLQNGNTSIGNNAPGSHRLYVESNATGAAGTTGIFKNTSASGIALAVVNSSTLSSDNVLLVSNHGSTGNLASFDSYQGTETYNRRFRFTNNGDGRCDGAWIAGGADYAEYFPKANTSIAYEPGDVIAMSPSIGYTVESADAKNENLVIGVYSSNPAIVGNSSAEEDPKDSVLVGLMGVISTKVNTENGPIKIGDFLTISSTSGVATKANKSGMVIGRAMENYTAGDQGMIKVLVATEWITMESQMDILKHKNEALNTIVKSLTAELVETKEEQYSNYKKLLKRVEQIEANSNQ